MGVAVGGVSPPPPLIFSSGLPGCGRGVCGCGSWPRCVVALWWSPSPVPVLAPLVPAPPPPFLWVPPFCFLFFAVSVFVWPVACHFSRGGVRRRVWGVFWSGPSAAVWSWWAAFSGRASLGWAGWSPGVLSAGLLGVAFGVACQGSFPPSVEWVRGFAVVRLSPPFSFFPASWRLCAAGWVGPPAFCFFFPGQGCLFLPSPSPGWCTHWSANGVATWVAVGLVGGRGPCPGPVRLVVYVHAPAGGPSCRVRLGLRQLGGCASRDGEVMGLRGRDVPCFPAAAVLFWWWRVLLSCGGFRGRAAAGGGGGVVPTGMWCPPAHAW